MKSVMPVVCWKCSRWIETPGDSSCGHRACLECFNKMLLCGLCLDTKLSRYVWCPAGSCWGVPEDCKCVKNNTERKLSTTAEVGCGLAPSEVELVKDRLATLAMHQQCVPKTPQQLLEIQKVLDAKIAESKAKNQKKLYLMRVCAKAVLAIQQPPARLTDRVQYLKRAYKCSLSEKSYTSKLEKVYPSMAVLAADLADFYGENGVFCAEFAIPPDAIRAACRIVAETHGLRVRLKEGKLSLKFSGCRLFRVSVLGC